MPVWIFIRNDFETFKPTHDVFVEYPLTGDGLVCSFLLLCQGSFPGLFLGSLAVCMDFL